MLKKLFWEFFQKNDHILIIFLGTLVWSLTMVKSGLIYSYGMGFWGPNGHDGIWHISVMNGLAKGSMQMPIFAGETIKNYHIGYDLLLAVIHRITNISLINLYFQIVPPIMAFLVGLLVYRFVYLWRSSKTQALWAAFFVYFSGSFGWVVTFIRGDGFGGESLFWAQQSLSTLINPPFALSLVVFFSILNLLVPQKNEPENNSGGKDRSGVWAVLSRYGGIKIIIITVLAGILFQIKIYAGILMLISLFIVGLWQFALNKEKQNLFIAVAAGVISLVILLPTYDLRSGGLILKPFWFLESMVATPDRFHWLKMASAIANYKLAGNYLKLAPSYGLLLVVFLLGNMGLRVISFPWFVKRIKNIKDLDGIDVIVLSIVSFGTLIPIFFIQKGNSWNSIQFFYYSLVFLSVVSGVAMGEYLEKRKRGSGFIILLVTLLTIPTTIATLRHYLPSRPPAMISNNEFAALKYLKDQPDGVVLTVPFNKELADRAIENPPRPLYLYESTAYVSALTKKYTYLEDEVNLEITNYDWRSRKSEILNNLNNVNFLHDKKIKYLYVASYKDFPYKDTWSKYMIYDQNGFAIFRIF